MRTFELHPAFDILEGKKPKEIFGGLRTPCYIIDEAGLQRNGEILLSLTKNTGCKVLLAQKAFSNYDFYPLLSGYLAGTEASGLFEARLGAEKMPGKEVHVFCAAYREDEFEELLEYADHIVFNSPGQLKKYGHTAKNRGKSIGLRINPQCSTQERHEIYDPCSSQSRLGTTREIWNQQMTDDELALLDGDLLLFGDMAIYSTCKNNTFNGMPLPDIWRRSLHRELKKLTDFGYEDFKMRLGK